MKDKKIYDIATDMDCTLALLEETARALSILRDVLEREGYQPEESFDEWKGIAFAKRFPLMLSTYNVIYRDLDSQLHDLKAAVNALFTSQGVKTE